jgi:hypothetical protein
MLGDGTTLDMGRSLDWRYRRRLNVNRFNTSREGRPWVGIEARIRHYLKKRN